MVENNAEEKRLNPKDVEATFTKHAETVNTLVNNQRILVERVTELEREKAEREKVAEPPKKEEPKKVEPIKEEPKKEEPVK